MAGMLGFLVGGAAEGWSEGRLSQIKADREARMKELEEQRTDRRALEAREFQSREAAIGREAQIGENKRQEGVQAIEKQKDRDATIARGADKPADQQMVEYLQTIGKTQDEALDWVKTSRGKSDEDSKLSLYRQHIAAGMQPDEANKATDEAWVRYGKSGSGGGSVPSDPVHIENATPSGAGTKEQPYRATTPNNLAWFKKFAKPGSYIIDPESGKIYRK